MREAKYGFVYLWFDRKHKRYYVGCRWGNIDDGYVCSSPWMKRAYGNRPRDFKRRILVTNIPSRAETYMAEQRFLDMIKLSEIKPENQSPRYYNLNTKNNKLWHSYDGNVQSIGQKISEAKKGKKTGPMSEERKANISKAKIAKQRVASEETRQRISQARKGIPRPESAKEATSLKMKEIWASGSRPRKKPKNSMSLEEQSKLCSEQLKSRWADPIWAANQRQKLRDSWAKRKA